MPFTPETPADYVFKAHAARAPYQNLPPDIAPATMDEAYAAQEALAKLLIPREGPVAGLKIAVATKIMQELMGIDRPCGGMIFERRVHASPHKLKLSDYINVVVEFELALRIGRDLPKQASPWTGETVKAAIAEVIPAFELIEDRHAVYKSTSALSMIADNCWNAGIVLGAPAAYDGRSLAGIAGDLEIDGKPARHGTTDDPLETLAWVANLAIARGRPMTAGMVVITGSVIPTLPIRAGARFVFQLAGLGSVEVAAL
jgi:2-oxo-3-hexenedioate decarboxylase/2-keto-4-pentenoate hydratase